MTIFNSRSYFIDLHFYKTQCTDTKGGDLMFGPLPSSGQPHWFRVRVPPLEQEVLGFLAEDLAAARWGQLPAPVGPERRGLLLARAICPPPPAGPEARLCGAAQHRPHDVGPPLLAAEPLQLIETALVFIIYDIMYKLYITDI